MRFTSPQVFLLAGALILPTLPALAQTPSVPPFAFTSGADVDAMAAKLKAGSIPGKSAVGRILNLGPYSTTIEYRNSTTPPSIHRSQAEIVYVVSGSATMKIGGTILNPAGADENHLVGTAIEGSTVQRVAKGDWFVMPQNTPHQFTDPHDLVIMSAHLVFPK